MKKEINEVRTHGNTKDNCFISTGVVLIHDFAAALCGIAHHRAELFIMPKVVQVVCEEIHVWDNFEDPRNRTRRHHLRNVQEEL